MKRTKTEYPGVFYREAIRIGGKGKEKVYYIVFKKAGKVLEEKAGRQYADDMTAAKTARIRADRIEGRRESRKEKCEFEKAAKNWLRPGNGLFPGCTMNMKRNEHHPRESGWTAGFSKNT